MTMTWFLSYSIQLQVCKLYLHTCEICNLVCDIIWQQNVLYWCISYQEAKWDIWGYSISLVSLRPHSRFSGTFCLKLIPKMSHCRSISVLVIERKWLQKVWVLAPIRFCRRNMADLLQLAKHPRCVHSSWAFFRWCITISKLCMICSVSSWIRRRSFFHPAGKKIVLASSLLGLLLDIQHSIWRRGSFVLVKSRTVKPTNCRIYLLLTLFLERVAASGENRPSFLIVFRPRAGPETLGGDCDGRRRSLPGVGRPAGDPDGSAPQPGHSGEGVSPAQGHQLPAGEEGRKTLEVLLHDFCDQ